METLVGYSQSDSLSNPQAIENILSAHAPAAKPSKEPHQHFKTLISEFESFSNKKDITGKVKIALRICTELSTYIKIEEQIFNSMTQDAREHEGRRNEKSARVAAKKLISDLHDITGTHPLYDAKVTSLGQYIDQYIKEDDSKIFS